MSSKKRWFQSSWCAVLLATLVASATMSCGSADGEGGSDDFFYVYVVHGYAGGGELSLYGSAGPLATGLKFGEIGGGEQAGTALKVDRTRFNGEVQILLSGASEIATVSVDSFAFYPGETVTLFLTRRSSSTAYDLRVMRHTQLANLSAAATRDNGSAFDCVLTVSNGFSLSNVYTPNVYDIQLQWQLPSAPLDPSEPNPAAPQSNLPVYDQMRDLKVETSCGAFTAGELGAAPAGVQQSVATTIGTRQQILSQITPTSWYYMTRGETGFLEFRLGQWLSAQGGGSTITAWRSSREYQQCVSSAIQMPVTPNSDGTVSCDTTKFSEISADPVKLRECNRPINYAGISISPDSPRGQDFYLSSNPTTSRCDFSYRPRTRSVDTIFDSVGGVDSLSAFKVPSFPRNTWSYITFFGSPINPLVYIVNSAPPTARPLTEVSNPLESTVEAGNGRSQAAVVAPTP